MIKHILVLPVFLFFFVLNTSNADASEFGTKAEAFIQTMADRAMNSFVTIEDEVALEKEFREILGDGFDVRAIGKWVLGRYWRRAEEAQKEEYLQLFEDFIIATYSSRFKTFSGEEIKLKVTQSVTRNDNDAIVRSEINRPGASEPTIVDWRVKADKDGVLKVVDVLIAGVSMSDTQRAEFQSVIRRNGGTVAGLIDVLRTKTKELVSDMETSSPN